MKYKYSIIKENLYLKNVLRNLFALKIRACESLRQVPLATILLFEIRYKTKTTSLIKVEPIIGVAKGEPRGHTTPRKFWHTLRGGVPSKILLLT